MLDADQETELYSVSVWKRIAASDKGREHDTYRLWFNKSGLDGFPDVFTTGSDVVEIRGKVLYIPGSIYFIHFDNAMRLMRIKYQ